jgi:hypothetical protein
MAIPRPLPATRLAASLPPERVPWISTDAIPRNGHRPPPQPRALHALELALHIDAQGYNIYLSGEANLGRVYMVRNFLAAHARRAATPPDILYVNNFDDDDRPCLIQIPPGAGRKIKKMMNAALTALRRELPGKLEQETFTRKRSERLEQYQSERAKLLRRMEHLAETKGFNLEVDDQGSLTLYPLIDGKRLNENDFEELDPAVRQDFKQKGDVLLSAMSEFVRRLGRAERKLRRDERGLEQEVVSAALENILTPVAQKILQFCPDNKELENWLKALHQDILDYPESVLPRDHAPPANPGTMPPAVPGAALSPPDGGMMDAPVYRHDINLFVDNSATKGAPIIIEDHPTATNLLGRIERESEMGALVTDFTLIKAGSLHRANGGFLVLRMEDLLQ